jgi:hypothetical protein
MMLLLLFALTAPPKGWFLAGMAPNDYETGVDRKVSHAGKSSAYLRAKETPTKFGTLMQMFKADNFRGKRVRLSAWVKAEKVAGWAGVWMRVDGEDNKSLAFDNMQNRPIKGTSGWTRYDVVLDVGDKATAVAFGILLDGAGMVWIDDIRFEVVDRSVPTTGFGGAQSHPAAPENLDFEE